MVSNCRGAAVLAAQQAAVAAQQQTAQAQHRLPPNATGGAATIFVTPHSAEASLAERKTNSYGTFGSAFLRDNTLSRVEPGSALFVGAFTSSLFVGCAAFGTYQWWQRWQQIIAPLTALANAMNGVVRVSSPTDFNANVSVKCVMVALVFLAVVLLFGTILRILGSQDDKGNIGDDLFITGIALLPVGLWILLSGLIEVSHSKTLAISGVFALCYTIILLHAGYTKVSHVKTAVATFCVPLFLVLSTSLTYFLVQKMLT